MTKVDLIAEAERSIDAIDHFMDGASLDTDEFAKLVRIRLDCLEFLADMNTATETSPTNLPRRSTRTRRCNRLAAITRSSRASNLRIAGTSSSSITQTKVNATSPSSRDRMPRSGRGSTRG